MKTLAVFLLLTILVQNTLKTNANKISLTSHSSFSTNASNKKQLPAPPQAQDLSNHFGTTPADNKFGPAAVSRGPAIPRADGSLPPEPLSNFSREIDVKEIVAGSLKNTASDAKKIVSAPITGPKLQIDTDLVHDTIVNTPVHVGNEFEQTTVSVLDRATGKVSVEKKVVKRPVLALMQTPREVVTPITTRVDLLTGKSITDGGEKVKLGS